MGEEQLTASGGLSGAMFDWREGTAPVEVESNSKLRYSIALRASAGRGKGVNGPASGRRLA